MSQNNRGNVLADHNTLFGHPRCSVERTSIVLDIQAAQYDTARSRLQNLYGKYYGITDADWQFLEALASVRSGLQKNTILTHGEGPQKACIHTHLLKGHAPLRDLYDVDVEPLFAAGLLRRPRICGEERKRIIHKPYFVLTPEATDCIDVGLVGPGVGDLGESVTHAVGARLYGEYMKHRISQETGDSASVTYYDDLILDDYDVDVAVHTYPPGRSHEKQLYAVGEVKTVISREKEALDALHKLGAVQCEVKHWITPRREMINEIVNIAVRRGWYTMDPVPETLSLETAAGSGIRSTNDRLAASEYVAHGMGMPLTTPLTAGFSYEMLYRKLKAADPATFDLPRVTTARL